MSEFLVVGGNGHVGREVVPQLLDAGHTVRALVRGEARAAALKRPGVTLLKGDLGDAASLAPALDGIARAYVATDDTEAAVAAYGVFLAEARRHGLAHVVRLSARSAAPDAPSVLSRRQAQRERMTEESGLAFTHLRPTWFMQMLEEYAPGGILAVPGGNGRIAWIDCRDIAAVAVAALTGEGHAGMTYEMTGPVPLSYGELAAEMSKATGQRFEYRDLAPDAYADQLRRENTPEPYIALLLELYERIRDDTMAELALGVQQALNRQPRSFAEYCRDNAAVLARQL